MAYIFLDESGDLGFSTGSSKYFLFTIAIVPERRVLENVVKKVWRTLKKQHKKLGELHAYRADHVTRIRILQRLNKIQDLKVLTIILNKEKVYVDLQNQKNLLYNYTANILLERLHTSKILNPRESIELYIDRKDTKKKLKENFISYLSDSMKSRREGEFMATLHTSHENKSIQAVDFISWAIFRKYESGDTQYYELIKEKIIAERRLFP